MAVKLTTDRRENAGSCNFCQRGTPNADETNLVFPYSHVMLLKCDLARGTGSMRLCPDCVAELRRQLETFTVPEVGHDSDMSRT